MKKLLGIVVLSFLLCSTAYAKIKVKKLQVLFKDENKIHVVDGTFGASLKGSGSVAADHCSSMGKESVMTNRGGQASELKKFYEDSGYKLGIYKWVDEFECVEKKIEVVEKQKKIDVASMIDKAKDTCKSLGFKEGTEKFADCSLKLYSQSVELAAEQNKQVVMQPQSSGSNVITIYDPVRDSNALMNKGMKMLSGKCTLGIDC